MACSHRSLSVLIYTQTPHGGIKWKENASLLEILISPEQAHRYCWCIVCCVDRLGWKQKPERTEKVCHNPTKSLDLHMLRDGQTTEDTKTFVALNKDKHQIQEVRGSIRDRCVVNKCTCGVDFFGFNKSPIKITFWCCFFCFVFLSCRTYKT